MYTIGRKLKYTFPFSFGDVRHWKAAALDGVESKLKERSDKLLSLADELAMSGVPQNWVGAAARAAKQQNATINDRMEHVVAEAAAAKRAIQHAADSLRDLEPKVSEADGLATAHQFAIEESGAIIDTKPVSQKLTADIEQDRIKIKQELSHRVEEVLKEANRIDLELAEILAKIRDGKINDDGASDLDQASAIGASQGVSYIEKYQVAPDPGGMVDYWGTPMTKGELDMLDLHDKIQVSGIHDEADETANYRYLSGQHVDAFRHAYASAMLTQMHGEDWAGRYTTAHERQPDNNPTDMAMDLHNNEVGRRIALEHPHATLEDLQRYVDKAIRNGELLVIGRDGNLVPSNEVTIIDRPPTSRPLPGSND